MPFEIPQDKQQKELLTEINSTLKKIQSSIDFIKSLHKFMDGSTENKSLDELREERLQGKYA